MNKSSKSITLVLLGSTLALAGCGRSQAVEEDWTSNSGTDTSTGLALAEPTATSSVHSSGPRFFFIPSFGGSRTGVGPSVGRTTTSTPSPSARGGFGSVGRSSVSA
ncbi:MAG: hypothetical protein SFX72_16295 [Isosphaeraceae bacterium]|nr:hypothetical protein [Isosphaeraceae bacterium]